MWRIGPALKYCSVPKYYDLDCQKVFLMLSAHPMIIQISGKSALLALKS